MLKQLLNFSFLTVAALTFSSNVNAVGQSRDPTPVVDEDGHFQYIIYLKERLAWEYPPGDELPAVSPLSDAAAFAFRARHRPSTRALVKDLAKRYNVRAVSMTSAALPSFAAFMTQETARELTHDPAVDKIEISFASYDFATWSNRTDGSETVPWGKAATGTDDANSSSVL